MTTRTPRRAAALLLAAVAFLGQARPTPMRTFETPYYTMHTDLPDADAREADLRMTRMFEEYQRRTSAFAGRVNGKFPFFLFKSPSDFIAAGAPPKAAGVYMEGPDGKKLMAIAGDKTSAETWHTLQHEGFHQFVSATMRRDIPIWVNEGLAEYFGEGIWTGDGFVTGIIPPPRLKDVKARIQARAFKPFSEMMTMSHDEWGDKLDYANYTQAWAMVHFLAHADNGKYQAAFIDFMQQITRGTAPARAWSNAFGADSAAFEARFSKWWLEQPDNPSRPLYVKSLVQTLTSFLARAQLQKRTFPDADAFLKNYTAPALAMNRDLWLPPDLFTQAAGVANKFGAWSIETAPGKLPTLVCIDKDGARFAGTFTLAANRVASVTVDSPKPAAGPASK